MSEWVAEKSGWIEAQTHRTLIKTLIKHTPSTYHQGDGKGEQHVANHEPERAHSKERVVDGRGKDLDDFPSNKRKLLEGQAAACLRRRFAEGGRSGAGG